MVRVVLGCWAPYQRGCNGRLWGRVSWLHCRLAWLCSCLGGLLCRLRWFLGRFRGLLCRFSWLWSHFLASILLHVASVSDVTVLAGEACDLRVILEAQTTAVDNSPVQEHARLPLKDVSKHLALTF